jgi:hypothetical protein
LHSAAAGDGTERMNRDPGMQKPKPAAQSECKITHTPGTAEAAPVRANHLVTTCGKACTPPRREYDLQIGIRNAARPPECLAGMIGTINDSVYLLVALAHSPLPFVARA